MIKLCLIALLALSTPAFAQSQDEVLDATLLPGWQMPGGHRMAALHLTLAPHWKTYWRAPGEVHPAAPRLVRLAEPARGRPALAQPRGDRAERHAKHRLP